MEEAIRLSLIDLHVILSRWKARDAPIDYIQLASAYKTVVLRRVEAFMRAQGGRPYYRGELNGPPMIVMDEHFKVLSIQFVSERNVLTQNVNTILATCDLNPMITTEKVYEVDYERIRNIKF